MALPINKWSEFKQVLKQLKDEKAHEMYENIIVDTVDIAYDLCEKYICNNNGVSNIGDIPYGGGYAQASKEFDECLRAIPQMGFGLVMISHSQDKTFKDETGSEYNQIVPTLANRPRLIVDRMADIIGYAHPMQEEDGTTHTTLFMRGTPRFVAGSRFKYTPESIEFTYDNLVNAIGDAIDKQAQETGNKFVTDKPSEAYKQPEPLDFNELMAEFEKLTDREDNHFTEKDVLDALQSFEDKGLITYPVNSIANRSGLEISKNKRNGLKQKIKPQPQPCRVQLKKWRTRRLMWPGPAKCPS